LRSKLDRRYTPYSRLDWMSDLGWSGWPTRQMESSEMNSGAQYCLSIRSSLLLQARDAIVYVMMIDS
jgi:hypothetical protein